MASDVMSVRLWLPRIRVLEVVADAPERGASTVRWPGCPGCGTRSGRCHERREREIRDLEVSGRPVVLVWSQPGTLRSRPIHKIPSVTVGCAGAFRRRVTDLVDPGRLVTQVAAELGISD